MEQEDERIEPFKYQLRQWRRLVKYLPPTDCDRDDVAAIEKLVQQGGAAQQAVQAETKNCADCKAHMSFIEMACCKCDLWKRTA